MSPDEVFIFSFLGAGVAFIVIKTGELTAQYVHLKRRQKELREMKDELLEMLIAKDVVGAFEDEDNKTRKKK